MKIAVAADHGGFNLKKEIIAFLEKASVEYKDFGTYTTESMDYPDIVIPVTEAVKEGGFDLGVIFCGTGIGVSIAANKVPGIRAALCNDTFSARMAREHNNANIITMGERVIGPGLAVEIIKTCLEATFQGGRHERRVEKIHCIEQKHYCRC